MISMSPVCALGAGGARLGLGEGGRGVGEASRNSEGTPVSDQSEGGARVVSG